MSCDFCFNEQRPIPGAHKRWRTDKTTKSHKLIWKLSTTKGDSPVLNPRDLGDDVSHKGECIKVKE